MIDRVKGILMKVKGLTEEEAYVLMRSTAMREKKKIGGYLVSFTVPPRRD